MDDISQIVQRISIIMPALLLALVIHEYAHAWMAQRFGDKTSAWSGRLTLNPVAHMDLFGTLIFPLVSIVLNAGFFFGWAKPVPIDPRQFRNYRKGLFWVAFAGPLSNIIFGFVTAFALVAFIKYVPESFSLHEAFKNMMYYLVGVNFVLAIFNLIPLPPLDGSNMVMSALDYESARRYESIANYSMWILLALMFSGALRVLLYPVMFFTNFALSSAGQILGLAVVL